MKAAIVVLALLAMSAAVYAAAPATTKPAPKATPKPTAKPTAKPTPKPTAKATAKPTGPVPICHFMCYDNGNTTNVRNAQVNTFKSWAKSQPKTPLAYWFLSWEKKVLTSIFNQKTCNIGGYWVAPNNSTNKAFQAFQKADANWKKYVMPLKRYAIDTPCPNWNKAS
eukprot:jgi/Chrzof1/7565/Cz02g28180.t1